MQKNVPVMSRPKKMIFNITFCLLIIVFLAFIEILLRWTGYGIDTRVFVKAKYLPQLYLENYNAPNKYFSKQTRTQNFTFAKALIRNSFPVKKSPNTLRGFVIGESSVQGFPYESNQSFTKITEHALKTAKKYSDVEIINLGVSAMTSYYVKDTALKILKYDPDFILIYAGHNEYYGNVSYTTGGNYFAKNLYLALKEFRVFQFLFDIFNFQGQTQTNYGTLMEKQFSEKQLPKNPKIDSEVTANFLKNIAAIVKAYSRNKIPVILVEPVCNLYDMPPFAGENDSVYHDFIIQYDNVIRDNNKEKLREFYEQRLLKKEYDTNANIRYLDALSLSILEGQPKAANFVAAKDLDIIPFRARSELIEGLRQYYHEQSMVYPNLYYIPLADDLQKEAGDGVFGNQIFIDQLHFNQRGQRLLSKVISAKIAQIFKFDAPQEEKVTAFFSDDAVINQAINFLPAYQISVGAKISALVNNAPFNKMLLKYKPDESGAFKPQSDLDRGLLELMKQRAEAAQNYDVDAIYVINYYLQNDRVDVAAQYVKASLAIYPGNNIPYLNAAKFNSQILYNFEEAKDYYIMAYLLSEKNPSIYNLMDQYFSSVNRPDILREINQKYGAPSKE